MTLGTRQLGSTGLDVSELALGTVRFGRETDEAASQEILRTYLDADGNLIDTADAIGPEYRGQLTLAGPAPDRPHVATPGYGLARRVLRARVGSSHTAG
jgi:predicted oxidoreductase